MGVLDRLRGPAALARLSLSYISGRPLAAMTGVPRRLRPFLLPACVGWASLLAFTGAVAALRIGVRVRRAPILRPRPSLLARADQLAAVCTLISDTHLVASRAVPAELDLDPGQWLWRGLPTGDELAAGLKRVLEHVRQHAAHTVLWCGDEVDSGDPAEWSRWREIVSSVPGLAHRLVPGNHDICFNQPFDEDYTLARRAVRERAFQDNAGRLADFPMVDTIVTEVGAAHVVLLDSCRHRSTHILSNAIGHFGDDQLDELARIAGRIHGPLLCITHHHLWRDAHFMQPDAWFNTALDAGRLVAILSAYRRRSPRNHVLICHGHRHALTAGMVGDPDAEIAVVGLPSTTLGDKSVTGMLDGKLRYGVAGLRHDGSWGVALHDVGPLIASGVRGVAQPATPPSPSVREPLHNSPGTRARSVYAAA